MAISSSAGSWLARGLRRAAVAVEPRHAVIERVIRERLTYLGKDALSLLDLHARQIEEQGVPGAILETGCALGGSSIVIAAAKSAARPLVLYDTFGLIPPPSERDGQDVHARYAVIASGESKGIGDDAYYGYHHDLLSEVRRTFERYGLDPRVNAVQFMQGFYEDTLQPDGVVAMAHIDCDWYDSVRVSLERIVPRLSPGGRLVVDDYYGYSGCRTAIWDFFRQRQDEFTFTYGPRLVIQRPLAAGTS
jgi:predicted O-methyltransferase YrrM